MENLPLTVFFFICIIVVVILCLSIIYLLFAYRKLLEKYSESLVNEDRNKVAKRIEVDANRFVDNKIDYEINRVSEEAVNLISKAGENISDEIRKKTLLKLEENQKIEENKINEEFNAAKQEIKKYKEDEMLKVKSLSKEILKKVTEDVLTDSLSEKDKEELILKALEHAKTNKLF